MGKHAKVIVPGSALVLLGVFTVWSGCQPAASVEQQGGAQPAAAQEYVTVSAGVIPPPLNTGLILSDRFDNFDIRNPAPWTVDFPDGVLTPHERERGRVVVFEGLGQQWVRLSRGLDAVRLKNRLIVVNLETRFTPAAMPASGPGGAASAANRAEVGPVGKIQLDVGGDKPLVWQIPPSSGWVDTRAVFHVPGAAERCELSIGLDKTAGTLAIHNLSIYELDPVKLCGWRDGRPPVRAGQRQNLLVGGDFEAGLKNFSAAAWRMTAGGRERVLETCTLDGDAPLGAKCLRVSSAGGVVGLSSNWLALSSTQSYLLSFYAKASGKLKLRADLVAADGTRLGSAVTLGTTWQRYVVRIPADWAKQKKNTPPMDLFYLQLASTGADWPVGSGLWLDGLLLEPGEGAVQPYVDGEAIPMTLALGRERPNDLSNLFETTEPVTAAVTVFNPLPIPATVQIKLDVRDGFEHAVFSEVKNAEIPGRARRQVDVTLKLARGWYRVTAEVVPPTALFGNAPVSMDEKIAAVITPPAPALAGATSQPAGAFGVQLGATTSPDLGLLGIGWGRLSADWKTTETARRQYDFALAATAANSARRAGLEVLAVLGPHLQREAVPAFYQADTAGTQPAEMGAAIRTPFSDWTGRLVRALGPKGVNAYQVLDEVNRDLSPADYLALYKLAGIQVQAHQPTAQTVADAGLLEGPGDPLAFIRECLGIEPSLAEQPLAVEFPGASNLNPEGIRPLLDSLMELKRTYGIPELWDVRFGGSGPSAYRTVFPVAGYLTAGPVASKPGASSVEASIQANARVALVDSPTLDAALVARGALLRAGAGLSRWAWAARTSAETTLADPINGPTLTEHDGALRPATVAYQFLAERLTGARSLALKTLKSQEGGMAYAASFERADKSVLVALWQPQPGERCLVQLPVSGSVTVSNLFGSLLAPRAGKRGYQLELGPAPLYLQAGAQEAAKLLEAVR